MELNALNTQYLNSPYVPFSASQPVPSGENSFDALLKKTQKNDTMPLSPASKKTPIDKSDKLYEACLELETFMMKNLLKSMRNTVQKTKLIDTGFAGEMYEDMLYDEYARDFAKNANFGFAEMAYRELTGQR